MVAGRPSLRYQALSTLLAGMMTAMLLTSLSGFWKLGTPSDRLALFAVLSAAFGWLVWRLPWVALGSVIAALVGGGLAIRYEPTLMLYLFKLEGQAASLWENLRVLQFDTTFGADLGTAFLALIAFGSALLITQEALAKGRTFWSIILGIVIFGTEWAWFYDRSESHFIGYLVMAFTLWVIAQAAHRDASWEVSGRKIGYRSHILTPLAALLVIALVATFLPISFTPLDLGSFGERAQEAFPVLKRLRGAGIGGAASRFSLRSTGFSPTMGALGGPVRLDHRVALHVSAEQPLRETLYLRGATFYTYTGTTWLEPDGEYAEVPKDGTVATNYNSSVLLSYVTVKVSPALSMGHTLFAPLEPMRVDGLKGNYKADPDGNLWSDRSIPKGTPYAVTSRIPTYSAEQIRTLSASSAGGAEHYLTVPSNMPARVGDLARSISERYTNPYDKAIAVESWLRSLPYELDVPAPPSGQDFVDHFLFDLREGYCVYSASAMTVMLREVGIPSRLIEGFAIPASAQYSESANGERTYVGLNSYAHAWVEAYFPGYGWVTFDPTPRGDLPVPDRSAPMPQGSTGTTTPAPTGDPNDSGEDPDGRDLEDLFGEDINTGGGAGTSGGVARELPIVLLSLLAMLGALLVVAYRKLHLQARIAAAEGGHVVQEAWSKTSWLMTLFSAGPAPWQTPREYASSLGNKWPTLRDPATQVAEDYTIARYAPPGTPISPEAPSRARDLWTKVHEHLFNRFGWRIYLWRRLRGKGDSTDSR